MNSPAVGRDADPLTPTSTSQPTRRQQACERCWKRKQKCDKLLPACTTCAELAIPCTARKAPGFETLPEEVSLSHASTVSYVESLKRKVDELENNLQNARQKRTRTLSNRHGSVHDNRNWALSPHARSLGHDVEPPPATSPCQAAPVAARDAGDGSVRAMMGEIGFLSRSAMAEPRDDSGELPRRLALDRVITAALGLDGTDPSQATSSNTQLFKLMIAKDHNISLKRENTIDYMNRFMAEVCIHRLYLDKDRMIEHYDHIVAESSSSDANGSVPGDIAVKYFNAYIAVAIGTLLSPESIHLTSFTTSLHASAIRYLPAILRFGDSLLTLHSMMALAIYSTYSANGGSAWHLVGLAMKKCISLGLHKEIDSQADLSPTEANERRRIFWGIYLLDRSLSLAMDRPFGIQDEDISVDIPSEEHSVNTGPRLSFDQYIITHARLTAHIRTTDRASPLFDYHNFCYWRDFPPSLDQIPRESRNSHMEFIDQLSCRTLIQMVMAVADKYDSPETSDESFRTVEREAMTSCKLVIERFYDHSDHGNFAGSFISAYNIFAAGVVFACITYRHYSRSDTRQDVLIRVTDVVNKCSTLITVISGRFSALKTFNRVLLALLSRLMELQATSSTVPSRQGILENLPRIIPDHLQQMIKQFTKA